MASQSDAKAEEIPHSIALVLIDGLGDVSVPFLNGNTPLQFASTRYLDSVAGSASQRLLRFCGPAVLDRLS